MRTRALILGTTAVVALPATVRELDPAGHIRLSLLPGGATAHHRLRRDAARVDIPRGTPHDDAFVGRSETFRDLVRIRVPVEPAQAAKSSLVLQVISQGCADRGVCYVPLTRQVQVPVPRR